MAVFSKEGAGQRFVELLRDVAKGDGYRIFAWAILSNHFHVVCRCSAVPLARTIGRIQSGFGRWRNRELRSRGPTWQSRYKEKLVEDESYLRQLVAYVHLNPVKAGLVSAPEEYELSGHKEILGQADFGLIDRDQVLSLYGSTEVEALHNYRSALAAGQGSDKDWLQSDPGGLPWWGRQKDRPLDVPRMTAWVDGSGRPNQESRARLEAQQFVEAACAEVGMSLAELVERSRRRDLTTLRFLVVGLGIERWGQRAGELAEVFGRRPDYVSWWAKKARELRLANPEWKRRYDSIDEKLRRRYEERS